MPHQGLHGFEIVSVIEERRGKRMSHDVRVDSLLDQSLFRYRLAETVNRFSG